MDKDIKKIFSQDNFNNYYLNIFNNEWEKFITPYFNYYYSLNKYTTNNKKIFLSNFHWYDFLYSFLYNVFNYSKINFINNQSIELLNSFDLTIKCNELSNLAGSCIANFNSHIIIESQIQNDTDFYKDYIEQINLDTIYSLNKKINEAKKIINEQKILFNHKTLCYSQNLKKLNFHYLGYGNKFINNRSDFDFENPNFNHAYFWSWNDDIEIRVVFTLYLQELYCELNNFKEPTNELMFRKINSFYTSEYNRELKYLFSLCYELINRFLNDNNLSIDNFINEFKTIILKIVIDYYKSLAFVTIIPTLSSENQIDLINKMNDINQNILVNNENNRFIIHYLINNFLDIHKINNSFNHSFKFYQKLTKNNHYYFLNVVVNISYGINIFSKNEKENKFKYNLNKNENVRLIYYSQVDKNISYSYNDYFFANNINESLKTELDDICFNLLNYVQADKLIIREGFIVFEIKSENFNNLGQYIDQIYQAINNKI